MDAVTWEQIGGFVAIVGLILVSIWRISIQIEKAKKDVEARQDKADAAFNLLVRDLVEHKLNSSDRFATKDGVVAATRDIVTELKGIRADLKESIANIRSEMHQIMERLERRVDKIEEQQ